MLRRQKPRTAQETAVVEPASQEEEMEFSNGGGGGSGPYFKSFSSVSSYTCRPDPDNPGNQICTHSEKTDTFDPLAGHSSWSKRTEEQVNGSFNPFGVFFGASAGEGGGRAGDRYPSGSGERSMGQKV